MSKTTVALTAVTCAGTLGALACATAGAAPASSGTAVRAITVIEHADTDATTDTGAPGDSAGDVLTFANGLWDRQDRKRVGTDQGYCVRVVAGTSYECTWTAFLPGGQVVVSGPFYDARSSTLAVTGGTGRYEGVRGSMRLTAREGGTKFAFAYRLSR